MHECTVIRNFICKVKEEKYLAGAKYYGDLKRCKELMSSGFVSNIKKKSNKVTADESK